MRIRAQLRWCVVAVYFLVLGRGLAQTDTRSPSRDRPVAAAVAQSGRFYALVIGINDYPAPMPKLKTPVHDAEAIAAVLHDRYGFEVKLLLEASATRANILNAITRYQATLSENDSLLIYYAGHGYSIRNPDKTYDKAYWLPVDADSPNSPNRIIADDLTTDIRLIPARHVLIISDSCYAGGMSRDGAAAGLSGTGAAYLNKMLAGRSRTLMASGGDEPVADGGPDGHSVFAAAILRALTQAEDPAFTASAIFYDAIKPQVGGNSDQLPVYDIIRNSSHDSGDFVFVRAAAPAFDAGEAYKRGMTLVRNRDFAAALPLFEKGCGASYAPACASLGVIYEEGIAVPKDLKHAMALYLQACDAHDGGGCTNLGLLYQDGAGVAKDMAKSVAWLQKGCDLGDPDGCFDLGLLYVRGNQVEKNLPKAFALYEKACSGSLAEGCTNLGMMYERGLSVPANAEQAVAFYRKGCKAGSDHGCYLLAQNLEDGDGTAKNPGEALRLYREVCERGTMVACADLGLMFEYGRGTAVDLEQALALERKACEARNDSGCINLGTMYTNGAGVEKDEKQAVTLYRKACDDKNATGCMNLGVMYEKGAGVEKDPKQAVALYGKGCDGDDSTGCYYLGMSYRDGFGVAADKAKAKEIFAKACDLGNEDGCAALKRLAP